MPATKGVLTASRRACTIFDIAAIEGATQETLLRELMPFTCGDALFWLTHARPRASLTVTVPRSLRQSLSFCVSQVVIILCSRSRKEVTCSG